MSVPSAFVSPLVLVSVFSLLWFVTGIVAGMAIQRRLAGGADNGEEERVGSKEGFEIYVGNLAYNVRPKELSKVFEKHGQVVSARVIRNRVTGKSKGFGFVSMATKAQADAAIKGLDGEEIRGRRIVTSGARAKGRED